jgi:hypothetical protein
VVVVEKGAPAPSEKSRVESFKGQSLKGRTREQIIALRPKSPKLTPEEFDAIIEKYSVSVGSLPVDFSREVVYSDHD